MLSRSVLAGLLLLVPPAYPATLQQAVEAALQRYPAVRVSEAEVRSAAAAIQLARTAYLPSVSGVAGINRATRNNVFGLLLPSQVLAPISGPVLGTNGLGSAWGSTVGVLANWEPFDFGLRQANVAVAEAGRARAEAGVGRTRLDIAIIVADTVLTIVAAEQTALAAQAAVARADELRRITEALVKAELRPGAELSLAEGEQASAQVQLLRARQAAAESKAVLAVLLGIDSKDVTVESAQLLSLAEPTLDSASLAANPAAQEQNAAMAEVQARLKSIDRSYYPRFALQGTTYARGTGAIPDGRLLGGLNGLGPNTQNWGLGFTASFNILDYPAIRARRAMETSHLDAEKAKYDLVLMDLRARQAKAQAAFEGAVAIARTAPAAIAAARAGDEQARARYRAGLGTALEVADAQRRLAQAEIDNSLARLSTWRAKLALAAAQGDLAPVLTEASR
ncbi:MAG: outer rane efflux protein [Bryobacterales bacterium]|nr:outer rane efflux protein [Bryobacterales bacterium]